MTNSFLAPGVPRLTHTKAITKRALYKRKYVPSLDAATASAPAPAAVATTKTKPIGGEKNGSERTISLQKAPRFYPAEDVHAPKKSRKSVAKPAKLRPSLVPGTVVILVAGRFRGKRVVFLKQLPSGLMLVTGPYKVNGVPLRRVNQAYVIATSTKVDISGLKLDEKINDDYFKREKKAQKLTEAEFFDSNAGKQKELPASKIEDQKAVDREVLAAVAKVPHLASYLSSSFSLTKGQAPHLLKF